MCRARWFVLCMVSMLAFVAIGCGVNIVDPGKDPGKDPKTPGQVGPGWAYTGGEGAQTRISYVAATPDGSAVYALGQFRYLARFGDVTIKSKGDTDSFLLKLDGQGKVLWAKVISALSKGAKFITVRPGGLALDTQGQPVVGVAVSGGSLFVGEKKINELHYGVSIIGVDTEGAYLKHRDLKDVYMLGGLDVARDGAVVIRGMTGAGGSVTFGSTTLPGPGRKELSFLGRLKPDWSPDWAIHIQSDYNNTFHEHLYFAFDAAGAIWVAGEVLAGIAGLTEKLPADFKGGSLLLKLDTKGALQWHALGSSITGHGKRFSANQIRHLHIDQKGKVWVVGVQAFKGTFGTKSFDETGLFAFSFNDKGEWQESHLYPSNQPLHQMVAHFAMVSTGEVLMWGVSKNITMPIEGGEISPQEPLFWGRWSPGTRAEITWRKEAKQHTLYQAHSWKEGVLLVGNDTSDAQNVFIEHRGTSQKSLWSAKSEGEEMLLPLQVEVLSDGRVVALVEWNGRDRYTASLPYNTKPQTYLFTFDKEGKLTGKAPFTGSRFALTASDQIFSFVHVAEETVVDTVSGKATIPAESLAVFFANAQGQRAEVVSIKASNINIDHVKVRKDGSLLIAGRWNKGRGFLGEHSGGINIDEKELQEGFIAHYSREGKKLWISEFAVQTVIMYTSELVVAESGHIFLFGSMWPKSAQAEGYQFGSKRIKFEKSGSYTMGYFATFDPKGTLLSANSLRDNVCDTAAPKAFATEGDKLFMVSNCREGGVAAKLGADGKVDWKVSLGATTQSQFVGMVKGPEGKLHLTGFFSGELTFGEKKIKAEGGADLFLATLSPEGVLQGLSSFGGKADDFVGGIALRGAELYFVGTTRGAFQLGQSSLQSQGGLQMFLTKTPIKDIH